MITIIAATLCVLLAFSSMLFSWYLMNPNYHKKRRDKK
jgi:hypothetical protein